MLIPVLKSSPSWLKQPVEGAAFLNLIPDTVPRYSERPNISFLAGTFLMGSKVWAEGISINYQQQINFSSGEVSGNFVDYRFNASNISSLYQNDLTEVRVNALFGMNLIRAF